MTPPFRSGERGRCSARRTARSTRANSLTGLLGSRDVRSAYPTPSDALRSPIASSLGPMLCWVYPRASGRRTCRDLLSTSSSRRAGCSGQPASNKPLWRRRYPPGCQTQSSANDMVGRSLSSLGLGKDRSGSRSSRPTVEGARLPASTRCRLSRQSTSAHMRPAELTNCQTVCLCAEIYIGFLTWVTFRSSRAENSWSARACAPNSRTVTRTTPSKVSSFGRPAERTQRLTRNSWLGTLRLSSRPRSELATMRPQSGTRGGLGESYARNAGRVEVLVAVRGALRARLGETPLDLVAERCGIPLDSR